MCLLIGIKYRSEQAHVICKVTFCGIVTPDAQGQGGDPFEKEVMKAN